MSLSRRIYTALLLAGLVWLGVEAAGISREVRELAQTVDPLDESARPLSEESRQVIALEKNLKRQAEELEFLQGLQNLMPQGKGFLRTQKAMMDELQALRRKVGERLGGRLHVLVDTRANKLTLKKGLTLLWEADCSVGRGGILVDPKTGRRWEFVTPRGRFEIRSKITQPLWIKPDWAFVESKEEIPPPDDPRRKAEGELGAYVLNLGDGYLIHGTKNEELLGQAVSHGCVRLGTADLEKLYQTAPVGTPVYIY